MAYEDDADEREEKVRAKRAPSPADMLKATREYEEKLDLFLKAAERRRTRVKDADENRRVSAYIAITRPTLINVSSMKVQLEDLVGGAG